MRRNRIILCTNILIIILINIVAGQQALLQPLSQTEHNGNIVGHKILKVYDYQNSGLKVSPPKAIFQDKSGRFWIGGGAEVPLQVYDLSQNRWTTFGEENDAVLPFSVESIYQTNGNQLWFAGSKRSASRHPFISSYDGKQWQKKTFEVNSGGSNSIGLFQGSNENLWLWVNDELLKYDGKQWLRCLKLSEKNKDASLVGEDSKVIGDQVARDYEIYSGIQDHSGVVWLGTRQGIVKYDDQKNVFITYAQPQTSNITTIYEDTARRLWFLNNLGKINILNAERNNWSFYDLFKVLPYAVPNDSTKAIRAFLILITAAYQDKLGQMLFATDRGLIVYSERDKKWELLTTENSLLPDNYITAILEDQSGRIWIGTRKGILILS